MRLRTKMMTVLVPLRSKGVRRAIIKVHNLNFGGWHNGGGGGGDLSWIILFLAAESRGSCGPLPRQ